MRPVARRAIRTTLYDLVLILHTHVGVEDDQAVSAFLAHLLRTKQITSQREWASKHGRIECCNVDRSVRCLSHSVNVRLASQAAQDQTGKPRTSHSERSHHEAELLPASMNDASW